MQHDVDSDAQLAEAADDQGKFWQVNDAAGCAGAGQDPEPVGVSPALGPVPAISVPRPSRREESR